MLGQILERLDPDQFSDRLAEVRLGAQGDVGDEAGHPRAHLARDRIEAERREVRFLYDDRVVRPPLNLAADLPGFVPGLIDEREFDPRVERQRGIPEPP